MPNPLADTLHLSSDHLSEADIDLLAGGDGATSMIGTVLEGEVQLMVDFYSTENDPDGARARQLGADGYSDEFVHMVLWAAARGARVVDLDAEGAIVDELPVLASELRAVPGR